jgi:hypothetical protein
LHAFSFQEKGFIMNNSTTVLLKVVALAGGALVGALLSRWVDELISKQAQSQSEYDKARYEQGLGPITPQSSVKEQSE